MADVLGKKLIAEIEEVGFDEILQELRWREDPSPEVFGLSPLDRLLDIVTQTRNTSTKASRPHPILEFVSLASGGGKTSLLQYIIALAILPGSRGPGKQACVVIIDTDGSFSITRLVQQIQLLARKESSTTLSQVEINDILSSALKHVHLFRPQSLAATTATIHSLPRYLFDGTRHHSYDRPLAFIALDSASAFYWQHKADVEDASLLAATTTRTTDSKSQASTGYAALSAALKEACASFSCPAIFTTWHLGMVSALQQGRQQEVRNLRPALPVPFSQLPTLRFIVQRVPIKKFPVGISVDEALREATDRQNAVDTGRFECVVNEWGMDDRTLQKLQRVGAGFGFRIGDEGVSIDDEMGDEGS